MCIAREFLWIGLVVSLAASAWGQPVRVDLTNERFVIGNGSLERVVELRPFLRTVAIRNVEMGREYPVESEEFLIVLDGGKLRLTARD